MPARPHATEARRLRATYEGEMAKRKVDGYQVIAKETRKLPHTLSEEERHKLRDREAELGEKVLALEREHEAVRTTEKEEARARREAIKDARSAWSEAIDARRTGVSQVERKVEIRAVVATQTIDVVVVSTGETLESRPMTEEEKLKHLQGPLDLGDAPAEGEAQAAPVEGDEASGVELWEDAPATTVEVPQADALDAGEAEALGLPAGWRRSWRGAEWTVKVNGDELTLREGDVHDVWLRLSDVVGVSVKELLDGREGVGPMNWLERQRVAYALKLLVEAGLARKAGREWVAVVADAPVEAPEPGRADPLPEAGDITRPRLSEPETVADAMLADAGETAAAWAM